MRKIIVCFMSILVLAGCNTNSTSTVKDTVPVHADMNGYGLNEEHQFLKTNVDEVLGFFDQSKNAIIYMGYIGCPWCVEAVPIMNEVARQEDVSIYYLDISQNDGEHGYTGEKRAKLIEKTKEFLDTNEQGEAAMYVPFVFVIREGKTVAAHISTIDGHNAHERLMDEDEKSELTKIYKEMFKK